jgi:hypothetical protein
MNNATASPANSIRQALGILADPGSVVEIRGLHVPTGRGKPSVVAGYFSDLDKAAEAAADLDKRKAAGVYFVLNRINPALSARSPEQLTDNLTPLAGDNDILQRRWLPIDFDPVRPAGISSTEEEHCAAEDMARNCAAWLQSLGWPFPILADSGNGFHLIYRIDLPADDSRLVQRCLNAIAQKMDSPAVTIDRRVFNPARIWKLYGTTARKGHNTADRPHRLAQVVEVPDSVEAVAVEQLQTLAATAEKVEPPRPSGNGQHASRLDIPRWLNDRGVRFHQKDRPDRFGRTVYLLEQCPFDASHGSTSETAVYQSPDGKLAASCMHNSCTGRGWQEFKKAIGPPAGEHFDPPLARRDNATISHDGRENNERLESAPRFVKLITSAELAALDTRPEYLIHKVLVKTMPTVMGGRSKAMKTSVMLDLAISLGSGTPFLNCFDSVHARAAVYSGESGRATIRAKALAVAESKGVKLSDCDVLWGFDLPKLSNGNHLELMHGIFEKEKIQVAIVDPLYLALLDAQTAGQASNIYAMGSVLQGLSRLSQSLDITIVLLHHFKKGPQADDAEPCSLEQLSQAGIGEWARGWVLLQRQSNYTGDGRHDLLMRVGSSVGFGALYRVQIDEGTMDNDFSGRKWEVNVTQAGDFREDAKRREQARRVEVRRSREAETLDADRKEIVGAMVKAKEAESKNGIRERVSCGHARFAKAFASLVADGTLQEGEVTKSNGQRYPGWTLRNEEK